MRESKIYTKEEIKEIMKNIKRQKEDGRKKEQFKQLYYSKTSYENINKDGEYFPYIISSYGRVFSINYKKKKGNLHQIKTHTDKDGYEICPINYNGKKLACKVHRLVSMIFIKNKDIKNKKEINHKDGNKLNNCYWNLEWCTNKENIVHAHISGLANFKGENNNSNKYKEKDIRKVCKYIEENKSLKWISENTNVSYHAITNILYKTCWTTVSNDYNFENYNYGKDSSYIEKIHEVCRLYETGLYKKKEISLITGLSIHIVLSILRKETHRDISKLYNI